MTKLVVSKCKGPLFVLQVNGVVSLSRSNFTNIAQGPLIIAKGTGHSSSLVSLSYIDIFDINNSDSVTYGNLINAQTLTIQLFSVHISNFTSIANGLLFLINTVLSSQQFSAIHGFAFASVIGLNVFTTISMYESYFEDVNSGGTLWFFMQSTAAIKRVTYREIVGFWDDNLHVYSTNLFSFQRSSTQSTVDYLDVLLLNQGYPKAFVIECSIQITNSIFSGPMGMAVVGANYASITLRNITIISSSGDTVLHAFAEVYYDLDQIILRDMTLVTTVWYLYESVLTLQRLEMINVTAPTFTRGLRFKMNIGEAVIDRSRITWLVGSGISV
jgi:hypothetical protein